MKEVKIKIKDIITPNVFEKTLRIKIDNSKYLITISLSIIAAVISLNKFYSLVLGPWFKFAIFIFVLNIIAGVFLRYLKSIYFIYSKTFQMNWEKN